MTDLENDDRSALFSVYRPGPIVFTHGKGSHLYDEQGKTYLDFVSGIAVNALGHAHPHLVAALEEQGRKLWHISNLYAIPGQVELAKRLTKRSFAEKVFFCNSGTEALEGLIKTARGYHTANGDEQRKEIIGFDGSFHGRTLASLAASGRDEGLFGPLARWFYSGPVRQP